ncbi:MAG: hypothetical protein ACRDRE_14555 [Pseudonocardiaceae bacterium]
MSTIRYCGVMACRVYPVRVASTLADTMGLIGGRDRQIRRHSVRGVACRYLFAEVSAPG